MRGTVEPETRAASKKAERVRAALAGMNAAFQAPIEPPVEHWDILERTEVAQQGFRHLIFGFDRDGNYDVYEVQDGDV